MGRQPSCGSAKRCTSCPSFLISLARSQTHPPDSKFRFVFMKQKFCYFQPGKRKVKFKLPKSYITVGKTPKKVFDIGTLNLETIFNVSFA